MDLIVKPTERCNFKCTFCSSTKITDDSNQELELEKIYRFLERYPECNTIIVNGGDPLMMKPDYYHKLLRHLDEHGYRASVSLTTNLYPFYINPIPWMEVMTHPRVGVCTSFQYGNGRLKGDGSVYTEEEFWRVSNHFLDLVGYRPQFIAVITKDNEDTAVKTVELAKKMGVICKVNYANDSGEVIVKNKVTMGNRNNPYVLADIYDRYLEIIEAGLGDYEHNCIELVASLKRRATVCPLNRRCDEGIRVLQPAGDYYSCGAFGDDRKHQIDFEQEMQGANFTPLQDDPELISLKNACFECPMFDICNGCRKNINQLKDNGLVEYHCKKMKSLAPKLLEVAGVSEFFQVTDYVDETKD
jgi:radical SAM protein with 4Fe4S-binding SPASM domain